MSSVPQVLAQRSITELHDINHSVIQQYIEYLRGRSNPRFGRRGLADSSISRRLAAVSSYLDFVRANSDSNLQNPITALHARWKKNNDPKPVDPDMLDLLILGIDLRDRTLFRLFLATGLRISEMHQLNRDSIHVERESSSEALTGLSALGK